MTGDSFTTIAYNYRVGISTVSGIVEEVTQAIWEALQPEFMPVPTSADWLTMAEEFKTKWHFPNCIGALDGKHVVLQAPPNSGSSHYNYKGTHSIVLMALVDANYMFRIIDVGAYGRNSDGGVLANSPLGRGLREHSLGIPDDIPLPGAELMGPMPFVIVGDEAFPLKRNLMRPYPGRNLPREERIYNYRLSRARNCVENAFGHLVSRWRLYHRVLDILPGKAEKIVKATCILQNFMRRHGEVDGPGDVTMDCATIAGVQSVGRFGANNASGEAMYLRDNFCEYFSSAAGQVAWQNTVI